MIEHHTDKSAKAALLIMLELYKRRVWMDVKSVNAISAGCLSKNSKMVMAGCKFMLDMDVDKEELEDDESDQEEKKIEIRRLIGSKMPQKKKDALRKMLKLLDRKQRRKHHVPLQKNFLPIDRVYDPQGFTEKLFAKLTKGKGKKKELKGESAVLAVSLVSKMIGRHRLIIPEFFTYAHHSIKVKNKNIDRILACIAEACHENLQRDDVKDIVGTIIDNMISEHCPPESATMGLNTIREISLRMSNVLDEGQLAYLVQFKDYKNRYVSNAAKSVINAYRDINPMLLPRKLRGIEKSKEETEGVTDRQGKAAGLELLQHEAGKDILTDKILDEDDLKRIKLLKLKESADSMGGAKERRDVLDLVREQIGKLREEYMTQDKDDMKLAGKRKNMEDAEEDEGENEEIEDDKEGKDEEGKDEEESGSEGSIDDEELELQIRKAEKKPQGEDDKSEDEDMEDIDPELEEYLEEDDEEEDVKEGEIKKEDKCKIEREPEQKPESESEAENGDANANQGFVSVEDINTFKKPSKDRIKEALALQVKEKHKRNVKKKTGSTTNKEKLKNKPYMMVLPKKRQGELRDKYKSIKERIRALQNKSNKIRQGKIKVHRKTFIKA